MLSIFHSLRFNVGLFLTLLTTASAGTLLPQRAFEPGKVAAFLRSRPLAGGAVDALGLFDLYHSWWFLGLLGLLAFDIVLCKVMKTPPDAGRANLPPEFDPEALRERLDDMAAVIEHRPLRAGRAVKAPPETAARGLESALAARGFKLHDRLGEERGRSAFLATRHGVQRWGSYLAHCAIVVILAGGLTRMLWGWDETLRIVDGNSSALAGRPGWEVAVDGFDVGYYPGSLAPRSFASELRVLDGGRELARGRVEVNRPLEVEGVRFYQTSWGAGGMFRRARILSGDKTVTLRQNAPAALPGTPLKVRAEVLMPDFAVGVDGRASTKSLELKNPAVRIRFESGAQRSQAVWLSLFEPKTAYKENAGGLLERSEGSPLRLVGVDPVLISGIQAGTDPGFPLTALGCGAWLMGSCLLFYLHRRRVWVLVEPGRVHGESRVSIGGWSSRGPEAFREEFDAVVRALKAGQA